MGVAFGHDFAGHDGVVDEDKIIHHWQVQLKQISYPSGIAATYNVFFDVMSAVFDTFCDALQRQFRALQPEINQFDVVTFFLGFLDEGVIGFGGQGGFDGEVLPQGDEFLDPRQHESSGSDFRTVGIEGIQTFRDFVTIDELTALQRFWQHRKRCGRFTGPITP